MNVTDVGQNSTSCRALGPDIVEDLAVPAAGLATSGHGPGPRVGRDAQVPSQPTAAAGAGPDFSCAGAPASSRSR